MKAPNSDVAIGEIFGVLSRRRWTILLAFACFLAISVVVVLVQMPKYGSVAKLFIRVGRENVSLDPTVTAGRTISVNASRETEINSVVQMLRGRPVIEKTVDLIGPEKITAKREAFEWVATLKQGLADGKQKLKDLITPPTPGSGGSDDRDDAISKVSEKLSVVAPEATAVIAISYQADSPQLAQQVVETVVAVYRKEHARLNRTQGSEEFFHAQAELSAQQLADAKASLSELKNECGFSSIESHLASLQLQKSNIESKRLNNAASLHASKAKRTSLESMIEAMEPTILVQRTEGIGHRGVEGMRQQLFNLEIREKELLSKYHEAHPEVQAVREQVKAARAIQEAPTDSRSQETYAIDPARQQLQLELLREESEMAAIAASDETLSEQHREILAQLARLNDYAVRHDELDEEVAMKTANYRTHRASFEQARISNALREQDISNVNVAQPATWNPRPVGLGRAVMAGIGLALSMVCAVGVGCLADLLDPTFRTRDELERVLSTSVLVSIPQRRNPLAGI